MHTKRVTLILNHNSWDIKDTIANNESIIWSTCAQISELMRCAHLKNVPTRKNELSNNSPCLSLSGWSQKFVHLLRFDLKYIKRYRMYLFILSYSVRNSVDLKRNILAMWKLPSHFWRWWIVVGSPDSEIINKGWLYVDLEVDELSFDYGDKCNRHRYIYIYRYIYGCVVVEKGSCTKGYRLLILYALSILYYKKFNKASLSGGVLDHMVWNIVISHVQSWSYKCFKRKS